MQETGVNISDGHQPALGTESRNKTRRSIDLNSHEMEKWSLC